ncbi:MAG: DsbE family thiol:disulfide interchange protein [Halocynthiibacter sp.]
MRRIPWLMVLPPLIFSGFLLLAGYVLLNPNDELPSARVGQEAPALQLTQLGGLPLFDDAALRAPGPKVVNIWASWCAPCRAEHPNLETLRELADVPLYGINFRDNPTKAQGFLRDLGNPYDAVGADANAKTALEWGVYGVPETYVLDGQGVITLRFAGPVTKEVLETKILPAIEAAR